MIWPVEKLFNPMLPNKTDEELANEFVNYFLDKIKKIRSNLTAIKPYTPKEYDTPALWRFTTHTISYTGKNGHAYLIMWTRYYSNKTTQTSIAQLHSCYHKDHQPITRQGRF